jgi:hypothetical protein
MSSPPLAVAAEVSSQQEAFTGSSGNLGAPDLKSF